MGEPIIASNGATTFRGGSGSLAWTLIEEKVLIGTSCAESDCVIIFWLSTLSFLVRRCAFFLRSTLNCYTPTALQLVSCWCPLGSPPRLVNKSLTTFQKGTKKRHRRKEKMRKKREDNKPGLGRALPGLEACGSSHLQPPSVTPYDSMTKVNKILLIINCPSQVMQVKVKDSWVYNQ